MNFILIYILFLAKILTIIVAMGILIFLVFIFKQNKSRRKVEFEINDLSKQYSEMQRMIRLAGMTELEKKTWIKKFKKQTKENNKIKRKNIKLSNIETIKPYLYILDFKGSIDAREVIALREEISIILSVATIQDKVLIRLESAGGLVHGYGLAAAQLERLRKNNINLTVIVDKLAASGGYMMACVANKIIAAPFSIIGSIGVVAQIPNFYRLLKKNNIDIEQHTAGKFKRTLTLFGENTKEGREKFQEELNTTHVLFKKFVHQKRPLIDINNVASGEHWFGIEAKEKGLIDEIGTSDDFIIDKIDTHKVISVQYRQQKRLIDRFIGNIVKKSVDYLLLR
ncbi:putative protease SohB [Candidatus Ecksteinia adelgidicola]|nr:putative protease SohB [Candidatus Ecksteinia adelgidicola]